MPANTAINDPGNNLKIRLVFIIGSSQRIRITSDTIAIIIAPGVIKFSICVNSLKVL
ncbi:hypothetical protein BMETH_279_2 [methanotrophic bacterial endosymbiont of Bathymodiolus sp.]|nr:hypothetical protein BMETH_279_2 [methanotrophic bacterial endosymbiont of Bathymodiolus sp.]